MATLNVAQVYAAARAGGFPPDTARKMVAIAKRESSFNPGVVGTINAEKEVSYGLWQINWKDAGIQALLKRNGITDPAQLYDPATNARAAALLWAGNDANLNTAWYINRTGNQYGYAEKYQANLAALPPADDLEMLFSGGGKLGGQPPTPGVQPKNDDLIMAGSAGGYVWNGTVEPGGDGGGGGGNGDGGGGDSVSMLPGNGDGGNLPTDQTASIGGLSGQTLLILAAVGLGVWWWFGDGD